MSVVRGRPVQDLVENQDPSVQFTYDEVTKQYIPWADPVEEQPAKRRGRPPKAVEPVEEGPDGGDAAGAGE